MPRMQIGRWASWLGAHHFLDGSSHMQSIMPSFLSLDGGKEIGEALPTAYNSTLVVLSVLIAALAAYAALGAADRMGVASTPNTRRLWLATGSVAMGIGVWAMHFIGMLAFTLPVRVDYDIVISAVSVLPALLASALVLHLIGQEWIGIWRLVFGGVLMGAGIGTMHYTGMAAMRMDAFMFYDPALFVLSVAVAVVLSIIALYTKFLIRGGAQSLRHWTTIAAALAMGVAISGMHYTGMAAAHFYSGDGSVGEAFPAIDPVWLAGLIGLATFLFVGITIFVIGKDWRVETVGRRFSYALTGIVTLGLVAFAIVAIFINIHKAQTSMETKLSGATNLAAVSLRTPLWNVDIDALQDFFDALLLDPDIVLAQVVHEGEEIATQVREDHRGQSFETFVNSNEFLVQTTDLSHEETPVGTLRLVISRSSVRQELLLNVFGIVALTTILVAGIAVTSLIISRRYIVRPLSQLQSSATMIAGGQLDTPIDLGSGDEIGLLSRDLNTMREAIRDRNAQLEEANATLEQRVAERTAELGQANEEIIALNERLKADNLRMGAELEITRRLQQMLLPTKEELRTIKGLEVAGYMEPADEVGGDYYDVLQHDGRVKIGIGDVTGHGLESGVMMVMAQTVVRALLTHGETDPVQFLDTLNRALYGNVQRMGTDKNLTLSLIDYVNGEVRLSGQHEEMIVMRRGGEMELVDTVDLGFPIGLESEITDFIGHTTVRLQPGDGVVLYTDGITEAENIAKEQFGLERLCKVVQEHWSQSAEAIKDAVVSRLREYIGHQIVYDDITLVVVKQR